MRNPNDPRFHKAQRLMQSGLMVGADRPVGRVTFQNVAQRAVMSKRTGVGRLHYLAVNDARPQHELHNIRTIDISRSIGQDSATCTITLWNTSPNQATSEGADSEGTLGYMSPGRGVAHREGVQSVYRDTDGTPYPSVWGWPTNNYLDVLIPNTVLRTFQGYGSDNFDEDNEPRRESQDGYVAPPEDTQLYQTGVWLIDKVTFGSDGSISVECRDLAKLLIEQPIYPPMIPLDRFPLIYRPAKESKGHREKIGRNVARFDSSSAHAPVLGHHGADAFDGQRHTYWLSPGNASPSAVEWLQATTTGRFNEVVLDCWGGSYVVYVSVHENGEWQGADPVAGSPNDVAGHGFMYVITHGDTLWDLAEQYYGDPTLWPHIARINNNIADPHWIYPGQRIKIPYVDGSNLPPPTSGGGIVPGTEDVKYVARAVVGPKGHAAIQLPRHYEGKHVRVSFTRLGRHRSTDDYRAGVRTMIVRNHIPSTYKKGNVGVPGHIEDWSEAVRELCAWGGFAWPDASPNGPDPLFGRSSKTNKPIRAWGYFEYLGAGPVHPIPPDYFVAKSFMDGVGLIRDMIGAIFYVDEEGGAQFRMPNIWSGGNYLTDDGQPATLTKHIKDRYPIEFHEDANLVGYQMQVDDSNVRSEILIVGGYPTAHASQPIAAGYVLGTNPLTQKTSMVNFDDVLAGQYRLTQIPGDTTRHYMTIHECLRMAELTALFIMFTYRKGQVSAPCHPGLQIDDQVRIFERVTHERFVHYVSGMDTHQDLESGEYTMNVTTHWLGHYLADGRDWLADKATLTPAVKRLAAIERRLGRAI